MGIRVGALSLFFSFLFFFCEEGGFELPLSRDRVRYVPEVKLVVVVVTRISVQFCSVRGYSFVW